MSESSRRVLQRLQARKAIASSRETAITSEPIGESPSADVSLSPRKLSRASSPVETIPSSLSQPSASIAAPAIAVSSSVAAPITYTEFAPLVRFATAMTDEIAYFNGANGTSARHHVKAFKRYLLLRGQTDDRIAADIFETFLEGRAEAWIDTQPEEVRTSWTRLQKAFLEQYEGGPGAEGAKEARYEKFASHLHPSLDLIREESDWETWLQRLYELGGDVPDDFVPQKALAFMAWRSLPYELQGVIALPKDSVAEFVNACRAIPRATYERVLADYDQRQEIAKQIRTQQQRENEERKLRSEMAEMRKTLDAVAYARPRMQLPPSPPMEQTQLWSRPALPAPPIMRALPPSPPRERFVEIRQMTFPDNAEGRAQYETAMRDFVRRHPRVTTQPPIDEPYPLTPGTQPAGSSECHRCGQRGHYTSECTNTPVPQAEQTYRRAEAQAGPRRFTSVSSVDASPITSVSSRIDQPTWSKSSVPLPPQEALAPVSRKKGIVLAQESSVTPESHVLLVSQVPSQPSQVGDVSSLSRTPIVDVKSLPSTQDSRTILPVSPSTTLVDETYASTTPSLAVCNVRSRLRSSAHVPRIASPPSSIRTPSPPPRTPSPPPRTPSPPPRTPSPPPRTPSPPPRTPSPPPRTPSPPPRTPSPPPRRQQQPQTQRRQRFSLSPSPAIYQHVSQRIPRKRIKVDLRVLQQRAALQRHSFFALMARVTADEAVGTSLIGKAVVDDGALVNVVALDFIRSLSLEPTPTDNWVRMANGARVRTSGSVRLTVSLSGAREGATPPREYDFEVLPDCPAAIILGKPWKTQANVLHFYKLDVLYVPNLEQPRFLRDWIRLVSVHAKDSEIALPDTPLEAIKLLATAQLPSPTIAELEALEEPTVASVAIEEDLDTLAVQAEEDETHDYAVTWPSTVISVPKSGQTRKVRFDLPSDDEELRDLQRKLVIEDNDPDYVAERQSYRSKFAPYRVNGKEDDTSEERAERVAQQLEVQFGTQGTQAERQHLRALLKAKHLAFAETAADCKQNRVVVCDPVLTEEPPNTVRRSKTQALSPPQKEFLHRQVHELIDNGFLVKIDKDQVRWISETRIVPKPAAEIDSNVSIEELQRQVNASLKAAGLDHDPDLPDPSPPPPSQHSPETVKARYRLVHNYAPVNRYMRDASFIPGDIAVKASKLSNKRYLFKGDGCAGFFIVANSPRATLLSVTYIEDLGFFGYTVMPFGFKVGPSLYYRFVTTAFGDLFDRDSDFWMDDVAAGHQDFGAYFTWLRVFLDRAIDTGFTLSISKCRFLHDSIVFCGQLVGQNGIQIDPNRLKAIADWPKPQTVRELMIFRGVCSYLRSKIPSFAKIFAPLDELTQRIDDYDQDIETLWTDKHDAAFLRIKHALVNSNVLKEPRYDRPFIVQSDWSAEGMGAVLMQEYDVYKDPQGRWKLDLGENAANATQKPRKRIAFPIAYASRKCLPSESRYSAHLGELAAAKFALDKFASFTFGQPMILVTDCTALQDILRSEKMPAAHARWREQLLAHNIVEVRHCAGRRHQLAHGLSHRPYDLTEDPSEPLHENGESFVNAIALADEEDLATRAQRYLEIDKQAGPLLKQFEGDELEPLLRFLLLLEQPESQHLRAKIRRQQSYVLQDGELCYVQDDQVLQVLPRKEARTFARTIHGRNHMGVSVTINILRLQENVTWPGMWRDLRDIVKRCQTCQQFGPRRSSTIDPVIVTSPMQTWAMDFVSLSTSHGRSKVLVIVDYFSRFVWAYAYSQQRGKDVVDALEDLHLTLAVLPARIVSDGASHFDCAEVAEYLAANEVEQRIVSAYAPWVNGLVERHNGLLVQTLRKLVASPLTEDTAKTMAWTPYLGLAVRELNRRPMEGMANWSPVELQFGFTIRDAKESQATQAADVATIRAQRAFVDVMRVEASSTFEETQAKRVASSVPYRSSREYQPGDLVLRHQTHLESTYSTQAKMAPRWIGPYAVVSSQRKTYIIRSLADGQMDRVHRDRLKPYWPDRASEDVWHVPEIRA